MPLSQSPDTASSCLLREPAGDPQLHKAACSLFSRAEREQSPARRASLRRSSACTAFLWELLAGGLATQKGSQRPHLPCLRRSFFASRPFPLRLYFYALEERYRKLRPGFTVKRHDDIIFVMINPINFRGASR